MTPPTTNPKLDDVLTRIHSPLMMQEGSSAEDVFILFPELNTAKQTILSDLKQVLNDNPTAMKQDGVLWIDLDEAIAALSTYVGVES